MIEPIISGDSANNEMLKNEILKYLDAQGTIKAELLHKIMKHLKSKFSINDDIFFTCLFNLFEERAIEIIIPELFKVKWKRCNLTNLTYLRDGSYFCRRFTKYKSKNLYPNKTNDYYFDSRQIKNQKLIIEWIEHLKLIIDKVKDVDKKMIILNPLNSNPINIYERNSDCNYHLNYIKFKPYIKEYLNNKFEIPLKQQAETLAIIKGYRTKYMCFYIPLIESILKYIEDLQKNTKDKDVLRHYIQKFAYQCIEFVKSDYIEINEPNPYRWESFFKFFDINIKILNYDFKSIKFYGRTFDTYNQLKYCIFIHEDDIELINKLKTMGYQVFKNYNLKDHLAIGLDLEFYFPCSTIEHIYFLSKYVCFYHLFLLFSHCFEYFEKRKPELRLTNKEKTLHQTFFPLVHSLFGVIEDKVSKKLIFNYYTYHSDELEIIYNWILVNNIRIIEKKLFKYFLLRSTKKF